MLINVNLVCLARLSDLGSRPGAKMRIGRNRPKNGSKHRFRHANILFSKILQNPLTYLLFLSLLMVKNSYYDI